VLSAADRLLTRDRGFYRRYFAGLKVLDPSVCHLSLLSDVDLSLLFVIMCREHGRTVWPAGIPLQARAGPPNHASQHRIEEPLATSILGLLVLLP
jgi:hypothetical protein